MPSSEVKKTFSFPRFLTETISFGALHSALFCTVLIPFLTNSGLLPLQLSIILLARKLVRLLSDSVFGMAFDKFGPKPVFLIGRLLKLSAYFLFLLPASFETYLLAVLVSGVSYSSIYGKVGAYIYNTLSANGKVSLYPRAMSIYYFVMDILLASMHFVAAGLFKIYGYNLLIYISIAMNITTVLIIMRVVPNAKQSGLHNYQAKSFKAIWQTLFEVAKKHPEFLYLLVFYGLINFLSWQFGSVASMILLDMGYTASGIAITGGACKIAMAVGCLVPMFVLHHGISIRRCCYVFTAFVAFALATAICYNSIMMIAFMCGIILCYTTVEVSIERTMDKVSDKRIRGTAISLAMTFCTIFTSSSIGLTGLIAQYASYQAAFIVITSIVIVLTLIVSFKLKEIDKI